MKKIFKLTPILSIPLLTSTTILITSCSNNYQEFVYTFDEQNKPEEFEPKDRSSLQEATIDEAANDLFEAYSKNKKILADQLVYQIINSSSLFPHLSLTGTIKVSIGKIDKVNRAISYKLVIDETDTVDNTHYYGEFDLKNIRQVVCHTLSNDKWLCVNTQQAYSLQGLDPYMQYLLLTTNRFDWEVDIKVNEPASRKLIERVSGFPEVEYYPGGLHIHTVASKLSDQDYVNMTFMQVYAIGNQQKETMYLSDVAIKDDSK